MKKLAAFTLLELVIAMLLVLITMSIGMLAFDISNQQLQHYKSTSDFFSEIQFLKMALEKDFFEAEKIGLTEKGVLLLGNKSIEYEFPFNISSQDKSIIQRLHPHHPNQIDTFYVNLLDWEIQFANKSSNGKLINQLVLKLQNQEDTLRIYTNKKYDSQSLLEGF